ncbi:MAG: response regulator [Actinomycetota bacterium]|nr:response regulator [Actinomycetota bacterium]
MGEGRAKDRAAPRVLLCDDAVAFSILFERWMVECGVDMVGQADTAQDAVAMARELHPDLIVIDHLLRDVTSDGLAPCLREAAPSAKLLLISGMPDDRLALAAEAAGADGHISKAVSAEAMCRAVLALLAPG